MTSISGDMVVKGRSFDVAVDPTQIFNHLDWPTIVPALDEAMREPAVVRSSLFNDVVYTEQPSDGSGGFTGIGPAAELATATFGAHVKADYQLAIVEAG